MTAQEVLQELENLGSEQTRKTYRRHGVSEPLYGVSYADLNKLKKRIKRNTPLALELWASGNHDARILATMVANPQELDEPTVDRWAQDLRGHIVTDAFTGLVRQTPWAQTKLGQWLGSDDEWLGRAGWNLLGELALHDQSLPDSFFEPFLDTIGREIHSHKNRVREAMNNALIAIGMRNATLAPQALTAAQQIGKVSVDHGETSCKTNDAGPYILKGLARKGIVVAG